MTPALPPTCLAGHDCAIVKGLIDACKQRREWCARVSLFLIITDFEYYGLLDQSILVDLVGAA